MTTDRFDQPDGFQWGYFKNGKDADIRYGHAPAAGTRRGAVVLLGGFRESIEKYFEAARDFQAQGFDVWMMDWRGQGGSSRYLQDQPHRAHHDGYEEQVETLKKFTSEVVKNPDGPAFLVAHSMGAHISLRFLKESPDAFAAAALSAPMLNIMTGSLPRPLARQMAAFAKNSGTFEKYVPGGSDWSEEKIVFDNNNKTSDPERFDNWAGLQRGNDALKMGDATYGWIYHTFRSCDVLSDEAFLKGIATPVLMQISGKESVVDKKAQERAAGLLPNCTTVVIDDALHEIWQERDDLRGQWLARTQRFFDERIAPPSPVPKKPKPPSPGCP